MMTVEEMVKRKKEMRLTYEAISEMSGVPLTTIQKIFGGITKSPRYETMKALEAVLKPESGGNPDGAYDYPEGSPRAGMVAEPRAYYGAYITGSSARSFADSYPLLPYKRQGEYTAEDRDSLPEDVRTELIDGVLYDMASPRNIHQVVIAEVNAQLRRCIEESGRQCYVFMAPSDVWLTCDNKNVLQPDLYVVCDYSMFGKDGRTKGAPPLIVEVLSPSTRSRDMLLKAYKYCSAGVKEYWIVDPEKRRIIVYNYEEEPDGTEHADYTFDDAVPVGISGGTCSVDFKRIAAVIQTLGV